MLACSTGSPASRRSTKFTPFTTRPPATSRQGMIRTFSMPVSGGLLQEGDRLGQIESAVIERAADDDAGGFRLAERRQIVETLHAPGGDHGDRQGGGEMTRRCDI